MLVGVIYYMSILFSHKIRVILADRAPRACSRNNILCCEFVYPSGWGNIFFATPTIEVTCLKAATGEYSSPFFGDLILFLQQRPNATLHLLHTNILFSASAHLTFRMLHGYILFLYIMFHAFFHTSLIFSHMCQHICACTHFKGESDKVAIKPQQSCDKLTHGKARFLFFAYDTRQKTQSRYPKAKPLLLSGFLHSVISKPILSSYQT